MIRYIKAAGIDAKTLEYADYDAYENAAIIADKGASVEILDGTFTDSYLGDKHQTYDDTPIWALIMPEVPQASVLSVTAQAIC